ncbi:MAG TPA: hypothetical protein VNB24_00870 [Acidimicrobiales bacterium]|nr:hypothetical protein [Acidimicrobiales bacterium]
MKRLIAVSGVAVMAALSFAVSPAAADHACDSTVVDGAGVAYVVVDNPENAHGGVWIYEESNGEAGLQRADDSCTGDGGDTIIF